MKILDLLGTIDGSGANENHFFQLAERAPARALSPGVIADEWYPVTRAYGLSLGVYVGVLSRIALEADERDSSWEEALLVPTHLFGEEMHWGSSGRSGIHHNLFRGLERVWGARPVGATRCEQSRTRLVKTIASTLADPFRGAGAILVVERTAPRIVDAFSAIVAARGVAPRSDPYLAVHTRIEPEHSRAAQQLVENLLSRGAGEENIESGVREMASRLGDYWNDLAAAVFAPAVLMEHQS